LEREKKKCKKNMVKKSFGGHIYKNEKVEQDKNHLKKKPNLASKLMLSKQRTYVSNKCVLLEHVILYIFKK
jgi:hypothetical protein